KAAPSSTKDAYPPAVVVEIDGEERTYFATSTSASTNGQVLARHSSSISTAEDAMSFIWSSVRNAIMSNRCEFEALASRLESLTRNVKLDWERHGERLWTEEEFEARLQMVQDGFRMVVEELAKRTAAWAGVNSELEGEALSEFTESLKQDINAVGEMILEHVTHGRSLDQLAEMLNSNTRTTMSFSDLSSLIRTGSTLESQLWDAMSGSEEQDT
ncbi:MAG: hypothetical protein FWF80_00160, partial [Defluviitaleaceae bacterium]|nr:hypothetical protein [Defluviitaleaceae bacterium]